MCLEHGRRHCRGDALAHGQLVRGLALREALPYILCLQSLKLAFPAHL